MEVRVEQLRNGQYIKYYPIFTDDRWHKVFDVNDCGSEIYLALEGYGHVKVQKGTKVEVM